MNSILSPDDRAFLGRAIEIARRGWGRVHPNPMVGCVLVKDGRVIGEGWHEEVGGPHAEVNAMHRASESVEGATAYVSLEPCDHHGRTPPCSEALSSGGIARVVYGAADPGDESSGGGETLRSAGLDVVGPALTRDEGRRENPAFFHNQEHRSTYVAIKLAQTLDGRISRTPGERSPITGPEARLEVHRLRAGFDGVMVGSTTVLVDDPLLTVRENVPLRKQPTRVILDTRARVSPEARVFEDIQEAPLVIFTGEGAPDGAVAALESAGASVFRAPRDGPGLSLELVLRTCFEEGINSLFCEGGGQLASELIRGRFAQRLYLFLAPFVLGEKGVPAFPGLESERAWDGWKPGAPGQVFGTDVCLTYDWMD